jgi:hypothetical protein
MTEVDDDGTPDSGSELVHKQGVSGAIGSVRQKKVILGVFLEIRSFERCH